MLRRKLIQGSVRTSSQALVAWETAAFTLSSTNLTEDGAVYAQKILMQCVEERRGALVKNYYHAYILLFSIISTPTTD